MSSRGTNTASVVGKYAREHHADMNYSESQLLLPTDKRNPSLSLYRTSDGQAIDVLYGFELMETVPNDPEHMAFKMMVARRHDPL